MEFEEHIIKVKKELLADSIKDLIIDFKITQAHNYMLQKVYIFAILQGEEFKDKHSIVTKYQASLKNFSNIVAVLKVANFLLDDKEKKVLDYANFANDTIVLFKTVHSVINMSTDIKEVDFIKAVMTKLKEKNIFLNVATKIKFDIYTQLIITILEIQDYKEKRDYTSVNLTLLSACLMLITGIFFSLPWLLLISIIVEVIKGKLESSELTKFLKKSIFAKSGILKEYLANDVYIDSQP